MGTSRSTVVVSEGEVVVVYRVVVFLDRDVFVVVGWCVVEAVAREAALTRPGSALCLGV
jgi:hypothetical protein